MNIATIAMNREFEVQKNQRAFFYTAAILLVLALLFIYIKWPKFEVKKLVVEEFVEVSLPDIPVEEEGGGGGNMQEASKGEPAPSEANNTEPAPQQDANPPQSDDNETDKEAPVIAKNNNPVKKNTPITNTNPAPAIPVEKPKKAKITMPGSNGSGGAGGTGKEDGYGPGNGNGTGNGTGPGNGSGTGGGNGNGTRPPSQPPKITKYYSFNGDLPSNVINANIKVSANGVGTFVSFARGSGSTDKRYAADIREKLKYMEFPKYTSDYTTVVTFNYKEN